MNNVIGSSEPNVNKIEVKCFTPKEIAHLCNISIEEVKRMLKESESLLKLFNLKLIRKKANIVKGYFDIVGEEEDIVRFYNEWKTKNLND